MTVPNLDWTLGAWSGRANRCHAMLKERAILCRLQYSVYALLKLGPGCRAGREDVRSPESSSRMHC